MRIGRIRPAFGSPLRLSVLRPLNRLFEHREAFEFKAQEEDDSPSTGIGTDAADTKSEKRKIVA